MASPQRSDSRAVVLWNALCADVHSKGVNVDQAACKPGSVHRPFGRMGDHSSGTILADRLAQPTRTERDSAPVSFETPVPIRSCSRRGLPCRPCFQERGALLPHPFTLTLPVARTGGLLSVALSLGSPVAQFAGRTLSAALPSWSPDFPRTVARPRSPGRLIDRGI